MNRGGHESLVARTRRLLTQYDLRASKRFGQNFLMDENILHKIVAAGEITAADKVLEIGPGLGALTMELTGRAGLVVAVEMDRSMTALLRQEMADSPNLVILEGDILRQDWKAIWQREFANQPAKVMGNIPYNISTPIIHKILSCHRQISLAVLMLQREVADRLMAEPGSSNYGSLTVAVAFRARVKRVALVSPTCFHPAPRVSSAVVRLDMRPEPAVTVPDEDFFFKVVRSAFQQRRKTMANSLAENLALPKERIVCAMEKAGILPKARPQELSLEEFGRLSGLLLDRLSREQ